MIQKKDADFIMNTVNELMTNISKVAGQVAVKELTDSDKSFIYLSLAEPIANAMGNSYDLGSKMACELYEEVLKEKINSWNKN